MNASVEANEVGTPVAAGEAPGVGRIFFSFLKLGLTAFGGPAIIAHIRELAVDRQQWLGGDAFRDGVVLCQALPGATAMQVAAYVGLKTRGLRGAVAAYAGLGLPAFFLMMLLSECYASSRTVDPVIALFAGLQVVVVAVVAQAAFSFGQDIGKSLGRSLLAVASAAALLLGGDPFLVIAGSAAVGMLLFRGAAPPPPPTRLARTAGRGRFVLVAVLAGAAGLLALRYAAPPLCTLSLLMLRINFFAFGGGLSALPLLHHEVVSRGWMESRAFLDGIALGQVTPGPISITGTFIGYLLFGVGGAVIATAATFAPSFLLLVASEPYLEKLKTSQLYASASKGIQSCFVGLLFYVTYRFASEIRWDAPREILMTCAFVALLKKTDILLVVLVGALFSLALLHNV